MSSSFDLTRATRIALLATVVAISAASCTSGSDDSAPERSRTTTAPATSQAPLPSGTPSPVALTWRFRVAPVQGYSIVRTSIGSDMQGAFVTSSEGDSSGAVSLFGPGVLPKADIADLRKGSRVTIHGTAGWFAEVGGQGALGWEYEPDAWAVVNGDWGTREGAAVDLGAARRPILAIATAVDTTAEDDFTVAYRTGYLPRGLVVADGETDVDLDGRPDGQIDLVDDVTGVRRNGRPAAPALLIRRTQSELSDLDPAIVDATGPTTSLSIDGRSAKYNKSAGWLSVDYPGNTHLQIVVDRKHLTRYPEAELVKIARSTSPVGDPTDTSTWIAASRAVPT